MSLVNRISEPEVRPGLAANFAEADFVLHSLLIIAPIEAQA